MVNSSGVQLLHGDVIRHSELGPVWSQGMAQGWAPTPFIKGGHQEKQKRNCSKFTTQVMVAILVSYGTRKGSKAKTCP